jgi:hypothetical protein
MTLRPESFVKNYERGPKITQNLDIVEKNAHEKTYF